MSTLHDVDSLIADSAASLNGDSGKMAGLLNDLQLLSGLLLKLPPTPILFLLPVSVQAGSNARIPLQFHSGPYQAAGVQFSALIPVGISFVSAELSSAALAAGKSIQTNVSGNKLTVIVIGFNQTAIPDGLLATLTFSVAPGISGDFFLPLINQAFSDADGQQIPYGKVTVAL